ncbi:MAG: RNA polymerase sigma factor [Pseudomonadota bacterium]|nr:RNA polymerase sigma factor [Pseudomonadota bacterium]
MMIIDRLLAPDALKGLIAERRGRLFKVAYAWCGERHLADDVVQEAMARAMDKCHQLRDPSRLDSWLYSILNNCWREHLRGRRPDIELDDQSLECTGCPEQINLSGDLAQRVLELMARLPEGQRQVLALVALEEFSYREVADTLDIPIGTVMSRLSRARQFLADRLEAVNCVADTSRPYMRRVK